MAQYRLGQYEEVLQSLARVEEIHARQKAPLGESDLAFRVMAHYRLRHKEQARETLVRLDELLKAPGSARNPVVEGYWREAEALILGAGKTTDP